MRNNWKSPSNPPEHSNPVLVWKEPVQPEEWILGNPTAHVGLAFFSRTYNQFTNSDGNRTSDLWWRVTAWQEPPKGPNEKICLSKHY